MHCSDGCRVVHGNDGCHMTVVYGSDGFQVVHGNDGCQVVDAISTVLGSMLGLSEVPKPIDTVVCQR